MRAVLISIRPYWCARIIAGLKTYELRKTAPNLQPPFKCYIYCTLGDELLRSAPAPYCKNVDGSTVYRQHILNGKVIGEFICDVIEPISKQNRHKISEASCVPLPDMYDYAGTKGIEGLKAWHISELEIYEEPKELSCFTAEETVYQNEFGWTFDSKRNTPIRKPPQSWRYVNKVLPAYRTTSDNPNRPIQ